MIRSGPLPRQAAQPFTQCLRHQLPEDQMSPVGLVCAKCKQRLYTQPPTGRCLTFWESQPVAYSLDGRPCFAFTLWWDDYQIRSLHPHGKSVKDPATSARIADERNG